MLKAVFEPTNIDIFHVYKESSALTAMVPAGTVVMKNSSNAKAVKKSDGTDVWGLLSQDVYPAYPGDVFRPFLNHQAYDGDQVGVYTEAGYFRTDQFVDASDSGTSYAPGQKLYVTNAGKLTNALADDGTPTATKGNIEVGRVVELSGNILFFFFYGLNSQMAVPGAQS